MVRLLVEFLRKIRYPFFCLIKKTKIRYSASVSNDVHFEGNNVVGRNCFLRNSHIGYATYMGDNVILNSTKVGRYCSIAQGAKVLIGKHPTKKFVSIHPAFYSLLKQSGFTYVNEQKFDEIVYCDKSEKVCVEIGSDVWIGTEALINNGVKIGNGAVVGAGALVLHDVQPFEIVAGVPAKRIGERFSKEEQQFLSHLQWWNKDISWVKEHADLFSDINKLKEWIIENEQ